MFSRHLGRGGEGIFCGVFLRSRYRQIPNTSSFLKLKFLKVWKDKQKQLPFDFNSFSFYALFVWTFFFFGGGETYTTNSRESTIGERSPKFAAVKNRPCCKAQWPCRMWGIQEVDKLAKFPRGKLLPGLTPFFGGSWLKVPWLFFFFFFGGHTRFPWWKAEHMAKDMVEMLCKKNQETGQET